MAESVSIKFRTGLKARVHAIAADEGISPNRLMNIALEEYLEREERKARYLAHITKRYQALRLDGSPVPPAEAVEWLNVLLLGNPAPEPPLPHP